MYDGLSYSVLGSGLAAYAPINSHSIARSGNIAVNNNFFFFTSGLPSRNPKHRVLPVYAIFWGTFSDTQVGVFQNFLTNIGSTSYWNLVKTYKNSGGWTAASVSFNGTIRTPCYYANPEPEKMEPANYCQLKQYNEQAILSDLVIKGSLARETYAQYIIFGGTDVTYTMHNPAGSKMGETLNASPGFCSTHSVCGKNMACAGFAYSYVQMMKNYLADCNIVGRIPNIGSYPNGDFALDNAIAFTLHELVESILSPPATNNNGVPVGSPTGGGAFQDASGQEPADKCTNIVMNMNGNSNIRVGLYNFVVFPMFHYISQDCRMAA